ncbi:MAG: ABC transporter ATP-binding protein [Desulfosalsimonadaceae bacterium]
MIRLKKLEIRLPGFTLGPVDISVETGECFILLGPTGAGKTLVLETIAGMLPPTCGCIELDGTDVTGLAPEKRGIGIVYQDFALFPHLSVMENITYGLRYCKKANRSSRERIEELMLHTGIRHLRSRSVTTLSGGEKQRVALVRALSVNPSILLLDEPLSSLDRGSRGEIQKLLKSLHRETGTTFIMVTHDFTEALFLGQRAAVLNKGRIEQTGPVPDILRRPRTPFVAGFAGIPNIFAAEFTDTRALIRGTALTLPQTPSGKKGYIAVRSEDIRILSGQSESGEKTLLRGKIKVITDLGPYGEVVVITPAAAFTVMLPRRELLALYEKTPAEVLLHIPPDAIHVLAQTEE